MNIKGALNKPIKHIRFSKKDKNFNKDKIQNNSTRHTA
jgi:hypothetical protein